MKNNSPKETLANCCDVDTLWALKNVRNVKFSTYTSTLVVYLLVKLSS